jgi:hypothetical protein
MDSSFPYHLAEENILRGVIHSEPFCSKIILLNLSQCFSDPLYRRVIESLSSWLISRSQNVTWRTFISMHLGDLSEGDQRKLIRLESIPLSGGLDYIKINEDVDELCAKKMREEMSSILEKTPIRAPLLNEMWGNLESVRKRWTANHLQETTSEEFLDEISSLYDPQNKPFYSRNLQKTSQQLKGFNPRCVYVLAGETGQGKSFIGLNLAVEAALQKIPVLYVHLEMTRRDHMTRVLSLLRGAPIEEGMTREEIESLVWEHQEPLKYLRHTFTCSSIGEIRDVCVRRAAEAMGSPWLLVVDHIGLVTGRGETNPTLEVSAVSKELLSIAREMNAIVLELAQYSRSANPGRRRTIYDLKDSSSLEQNANSVLLLNDVKTGMHQERLVEICVAKNRNGISSPEKGIALQMSPSGRVREVEYAT